MDELLHEAVTFSLRNNDRVVGQGEPETVKVPNEKMIPEKIAVLEVYKQVKLNTTTEYIAIAGGVFIAGVGLFFGASVGVYSAFVLIAPMMFFLIKDTKHKIYLYNKYLAEDKKKERAGL